MIDDHFRNAALIGHVPHHYKHAVLERTNQRRPKHNRQVTRIHLNDTHSHTQ